MASSVSSESTFSSAGITITKRHNRLKGDIVEALQCIKGLIHQDNLFREVTTAADEEARLDLEDEEPANQEAITADVVEAGYNWSYDSEQLEDNLHTDEESEAAQAINVVE